MTRRPRPRVPPALVLLGAIALGAGLVLGVGTVRHVQQGTAARPLASASPPTAVPPPTAAAPSAQLPTEAPRPTEAPTQAPAPADSPDATVARFYHLIELHQFDAAVQLWSGRMQASYPPGENIYQRFADTSSLTLQRDQVTSDSGSSAVVSIDLMEVRGGRTYHWTGSWYLVRAQDWLLDQPALRPA